MISQFHSSYRSLYYSHISSTHGQEEEEEQQEEDSPNQNGGDRFVSLEDILRHPRLRSYLESYSSSSTPGNNNNAPKRSREELEGELMEAIGSGNEYEWSMDRRWIRWIGSAGESEDDDDDEGEGEDDDEEWY